MRDLIFVSLEPWDDIWRRNQFLCAHLARRFPQQRILFVARPLFVPLVLRAFLRLPSGPTLRALRCALWPKVQAVPGHPNIFLSTPLKWLPNPLPGARAFNERSIRRVVARAARKVGVKAPLLWLNPHDAGHLIGHLGERGVVYDITDDWELAAPPGPRREAIAAADRELCRRADLTIVCSRALFDSRQGIAQRLLLLPNGVDAEHYDLGDEADPRPPGHFLPDGEFVPDDPTQKNAATPGVGGQAWPRPVFGYTGSLHRERIDLELVAALAKRFPSGSVVLIGPHYYRANDSTLQNLLKEHPNVFAPGAVAYETIPQVMARFDACIVPHRRSEFVESLNPIKLWEFLACGKPIVSTDVAGFRDYPNVIRLAQNQDEFLEACQDALQEVNACAGKSQSDPTRCSTQERQSEAKRHSWKARVDELLGAWRDAGLTETGAN